MPPSPRQPQHRPPVPPPNLPTPVPAAGNPHPSNDEPPGNTVQPEWIFAGGMNAREALAAVLGSDNLTGNNQADARAAMQAIATFLANLDTYRSLILHLMYNDYARRGDSRPAHERNNWVWVSGQIKQPPATVYKWAHAAECHDSIPEDLA